MSCAGTLVADDAASLGVERLGQPPWTGRGLTDLIEFPSFQIPPGSRRGIVPGRRIRGLRASFGRSWPTRNEVVK